MIKNTRTKRLKAIMGTIMDGRKAKVILTKTGKSIISANN
jgi:hypothetical protein